MLLVGALLATAAAATALALDDRPDPPDLQVTWGGSEGEPACQYDEVGRVVRATIAVTGTASEAGSVTVTVTTYADENTSRAVGSSSHTLDVAGDLDERVVLTIPVDREPHVDEDGVAACRLEVDQDRAG